MDRIATDCWFLTGHTASGKSQVAVAVAHKIEAEIVAMDSMTVYRGMDIGTAKPAVANRQGVVHHLIDIVDPNQQFTFHEYLAAAHRVVDDIRQRGKQILFVGGTPLYLKGLLQGVFEGPPADPDFRAEVESELARVGSVALHQRLQQVDPLSAAKLHPNNTRRIIRALEVYRCTGQPISHLQLQFENPARQRHLRVVMLDWPRPRIHERIDHRAEEMFRRGLVDEVRSLLDRYGPLSKTAMQAVGYREASDFIAGVLSWEQAILSTRQRTRQLARRQQTWFHSLPEVQRLPMWEESAEVTAARFVTLVRAADPTA